MEIPARSAGRPFPGIDFDAKQGADGGRYLLLERQCRN